MVIINTKAVEVSIQAVSPELILSVPMSCGSVGAAGAVAASAAAGAVESAAGPEACAADGVVAGVSSAHTAGMESVNSPRKSNRRNSVVINANPFLNGLSVPLVCTNSYDVCQIEDKNLSITDLAGLGRVGDCFDDLVRERIDHGDFNFYLRDELDRILGTPVNFGVPALTAKAANVGDGDALHAHVADCLANIIELERFNNGSN